MDKQKKKKLLRIVRIIAIVLLILLIFKGTALMAILIALSIGLSFIVNNLHIRQIGIELVTFIAVLAGMKYGPWTSIIITFVLITYHLVAGGFFGEYVLWVIPAYCIAAVISGFMPLADISRLGLYITLGINANNLFFTAITRPGFIPGYLPYVVTNVLFNMLLFSLIAKPMLLVIG